MGKARQAGVAATFYMHSQWGPGFGDAVPLQNTLRASASAVEPAVCLKFIRSLSLHDFRSIGL